MSVAGTVAMRLPGTENAKLPTGAVELQATEVDILSEAKTPPFYINEPDAPVDETLRLKYRYLDIRREPMQRRLMLRSRMVQAIREVHHANGFVEVETPTLIKSTPEGARDFIVPSRLQPGHRLRPAAEPAAAQAAADGRRHRPLHADRPVLPRRGPARRPPARVHPARPRDELRRRGRRDGLRRGDGHRGLARQRARPAAAPGAVPADDLRGGPRAVRLGQAGRPLRHGAGRPRQRPRRRRTARRRRASACSIRRSRPAAGSRRSWRPAWPA